MLSSARAESPFVEVAASSQAEAFTTGVMGTARHCRQCQVQWQHALATVTECHQQNFSIQSFVSGQKIIEKGMTRFSC